MPEAWRGYALERYGADAPLRMTDGSLADYRPWEDGFDPDAWLDRAVHATRTAVFPLHGMDPTP